LALLCGCAAAVGAAPALLVFGEVHDQPDQQRQVADEVRRLAGAGKLAAVVLEMAEAPHGTAGLPRDATASQAQQALDWRGWPWPPYADVVMNAVRAGVPVLGGNLSRSALRGAMADAALDARVDEAVRGLLGDAVRSGHCGLLPDSRLPGMVRVQIARDDAMARVVAAALRAAPSGSTVLLLTGAQHASHDRGVPRHLAANGVDLPAWVVMFGEAGTGLVADEWRPAVFTPQEDHCAALRQRMAAPPTASAPGR
jgi:uncharacterized iron-regulated protein